MKKIFALALIPLLMMAGCKRDITSINVDPKNPQVAPSGGFFTSAQRSMANLLTSSNVNTNIFRLVTQYWQETTYVDESQYDIITRQQPRQMWNTLYRDVIRDLRESKALIANETYNANDLDENTAVKENRLAVAEIMEIYAWYYLVTSFGDVPYTEAMDIENTQPKYDDQETIYKDLLTRLTAAIGKLDEDYGSFDEGDVIYGGDPAMWKRFANTFKIKMAMTIADADPTLARTTVESALATASGGVFRSNTDNAVFQYLGAPPNTNPVWVDLVQSGRKDFVAASTIVTTMLDLADPRIDEYFTVDSDNGYSGGTPGASSSYTKFSKPDEAIVEPDFPAILLSYSELQFFLAEAKLRWPTLNTGATAQEHYANAIQASFREWGAGDAAAYIAKPTVALVAATWTEAAKERIAEQKWIALYNRGWDSWIEVRRLDLDEEFPAPVGAESEFPKRFTYPIPEQNINTANYNAAASAVGGDVVETNLFWDVD